MKNTMTSFCWWSWTLDSLFSKTITHHFWHCRFHILFGILLMLIWEELLISESEVVKNALNKQFRHVLFRLLPEKNFVKKSNVFFLWKYNNFFVKKTNRGCWWFKWINQIIHMMKEGIVQWRLQNHNSHRVLDVIEIEIWWWYIWIGVLFNKDKLA